MSEQILALTGEGAERSQDILAGCIPDELIATEAMRQFKQRPGREVAENRPILRIQSGSRRYDTDAYLEHHGVSTDEPISSGLRETMRAVEALPLGNDGDNVTLELARNSIAAIRQLSGTLELISPGPVHPTLYEHAMGIMAEAASRIANAPREVMQDPEVRGQLKAALLSPRRRIFPTSTRPTRTIFTSRCIGAGPRRADLRRAWVDCARSVRLRCRV